MLENNNKTNIIHILYVDDYPLDRELVRDALERENSHGEFRVTEAASRQEFEAHLAQEGFQYDIVLSDFNILGFEGLQVLKAVQTKAPKVPVIIVTGTGSEEVAVTAMKQGAADYVIKSPKHIRRLPATIYAVLENARLKDQQEGSRIALQKYAQRLKTLREIDQAILEARSPQMIAQAALRQILLLLPCQRASVITFDAGGNQGTMLALASVNGEGLPAVNGEDSSFVLHSNSWKVLRAGQVRAVKDIRRLPHRTEIDRHLLNQGIRAYLNLPLVCQGKLIGSLNLGRSTPGDFAPGQIEIARDVADQLAVAIQQARLYEQRERHAAKLEQHVAELSRAQAAEREQRQLAEALRDVGIALSGTLEFDTLLDRLLDQIGRVVPYDAAKIMLLEAGKVELARQRGYEELGLEVATEVEFFAQSIYLRAMMQSGQPLLIPDMAANREEQARHLHFGSWAGAPIVVQGEAIAFFSLYKVEKDVYQPKHATGLAAFAGQAAIAFQNARLFEQAQQEIRERKRAEAALEEERSSLALRVRERTYELSAANAELSRAARLKDEFLASMSHELRTPLSTILGLSEILLEGLHGPLNKDQYDFLQNIEHSGRHLLALINDVLDVAKIEAGQIELEPSLVMVEYLCQASLRLIKQSATKKRLRLSFSFDSAVKDIMADERRLKQILINLLSNAVKFTPEGGAMGLEVRGDQEAQTLHFTVWDTGIGIAKENFQHLFKPFTQLDSRLSREYNGTGLGLTLVHRLTELHGGGVSVTSQLGQGSCFTVSLPWQKPKYDLFSRREMNSRQPKANSLPPSAFSHRILLAEDNEMMLRTISNYLQAKKYAVIVARNGNEAIAQTLEEKPDLILMDIQMPVCDGLEAIKCIRANKALNSIPIIALTALAMPGDRERCLQAGANDYLAKPVRLKRLVETIEQHLTKGEKDREILSHSTSFI